MAQASRNLYALVARCGLTLGVGDDEPVAVMAGDDVDVEVLQVLVGGGVVVEGGRADCVERRRRGGGDASDDCEQFTEKRRLGRG